ncbi:hypothetical protein DICSQDRAFT_74684 [Dichomitus squalens LYAD-421 SS1]|uniref:Uncharacterized protein n=1 Tax=Dichomitus squalens (strain LYAD-421) TaxID=732165 RepID=R7SHU9_DICSQ|nr:uncharacterized protein DICSQDRAFT_74684 [Dichomitus squalens LYAD-421 SS1]EJF55305.1 hypothetical protein DICSQDRAFT_74684 [Dichomitus squalens LYAD-421 SS1]
MRDLVRLKSTPLQHRLQHWTPFTVVRQRWPVSDAFELSRVHSDDVGSDDEAQKFDLRNVKDALLRFQEEVVLLKTLVDSPSTFRVSGCILGEDQNVVHIDDNPSFVNHVLEKIVHHGLKGGGQVTKPKEHYCGFEESLLALEGCLPLVSVPDPNVVVARAQVHLRENGSSLQLVDQGLHEGDRVDVLHGSFIQITIVLAGSQRAILLSDEEEWGHHGGCGVADVSLSKVFFNELV